MKKVVAIVMASGFGRRMKLAENKLLLPANGRLLFMHTLDVIKVTGMAAMVVTSVPEIASYARELGFGCTDNPRRQEGISAAIRQGIAACGEGFDGYMFFSCDQPFLRAAVIEELLRAFARETAVIVPRVNEKTYSPCIFPVQYKQELLALTGEQGGKYILRKDPACIFVDFSNARDFFDVDTAEDFAQMKDIFHRRI